MTMRRLAHQCGGLNRFSNSGIMARMLASDMVDPWFQSGRSINKFKQRRIGLESG